MDIFEKFFHIWNLWGPMHLSINVWCWSGKNSKSWYSLIHMLCNMGSWCRWCCSNENNFTWSRCPKSGLIAIIITPIATIYYGLVLLQTQITTHNAILRVREILAIQESINNNFTSSCYISFRKIHIVKTV